MIVVYSYIGPLPEYTIDPIIQTRLFYKGPIYFILNDHSSPFVPMLRDHGVIIVPYETVMDTTFNECIQQYFHKFTILEGLKGREKLFIYAFERFFVLHQLMKQRDLTNVFFMELDNLIYDDPLKWEPACWSAEMSFMFDNYDRCASGICFIQTQQVLSDFCACCLQYIIQTDIRYQFMTEMQALDAFWKAHPERVHLLPTHWPSDRVPPGTCQNYDRYNDTLFDSAGLGIYFGGTDPIHTGGLIMTGGRSIWSAIDYTPYRMEWKKDEEGRQIPYIVWEQRWIRINNLHIHSKQLKPHLSVQ